MKTGRYVLLLSLLAGSPSFAAPGPDATASADPLTAMIHTEDVDRFAEIFDAADGKPGAEALQRGYIDPGSKGVRVFMPGRIRDAANLAAKVSQHSDQYRRALDVCLPWVKAAEPELRSIYLALHGLLPDQPLPEVYVVVGATNSGGTAAPGVQVLGLEVLCAQSPTPEAMRRTLRRFFAHETAHTFQNVPDSGNAPDPLLTAALVEGGADFIAWLVTGIVPDTARAAWAAPRETELWRRFEADRALVRGHDSSDASHDSSEAMHRWIANAGKPPEGWPSELGYWIGMRIWQRYFAAAKDKHAAVHDVLNWRDAQHVLRVAGPPAPVHP